MQRGSRDDGRHRDLKAIPAYYRQVRPAYRAFLSRLTAVDLVRPLSDAGSSRTWVWAVGHLAEHESYHLGKCMLLRNRLPERHPVEGGKSDRRWQNGSRGCCQAKRGSKAT
jgi:uncharacterized damage-inducible protein DinB